MGPRNSHQVLSSSPSLSLSLPPPLSLQDERKAVYGIKVSSFTENNYVNIDTLFLLIDALLFTNLVEYKDNNPNTINKSYEQIYKVLLILS